MKYGLDQPGCYVNFEYNNVDVGFQGMSVACDESFSVASITASTSASASAKPSASGITKPCTSATTSYGNYTGMGMKKLK